MIYFKNIVNIAFFFIGITPRLIIGLVWVLVKSSQVSSLRAIAIVTADMAYC